VWEVFQGDAALLYSLRESEVPIQSVAISSDGILAAAGSSSGRVQMWRVPGGDSLRGWDTGQGALRALAFSPTGALLATASDDHTIVLWTVRP
jgi:WD40 repeat protein